jgi:hypothetical protein
MAYAEAGIREFAAICEFYVCRLFFCHLQTVVLISVLFFLANRLRYKFDFTKLTILRSQVQKYLADALCTADKTNASRLNAN